MKNGICSALVSKRGVFLCSALLACGSIGGTFTIPIPDKYPDATRMDAHLPPGKALASAPKHAVQAAPVVAHAKAGIVGSRLPSMRNTINGDDADSRIARLPVSMPIADDWHANGESAYFDSRQASDAPDQADYATGGNGAPGSAFGGAGGGFVSGWAGGTISSTASGASALASGGVQGTQPSSGLGSTTSGSSCLASPGSATTVPLGAGSCFVADSASSGSQGDTIAQVDTSTSFVARQSNSARPGSDSDGGSSSSSGTTAGTVGPPSVTPPSLSPPSSPPVIPPAVTPPPTVVDITPFTPNSVVNFSVENSGGPNFIPAADPPGSAAVPEPATLALVFLGFAGLVVARKGKS